MSEPHISLIGQFIVDVTLPQHGESYKLRAGGVMHAARALWAIGHSYSICYCAPDYLEAQVAENAKQYDAIDVRRFGIVKGCPNVMLIGEPKEAGDQRYEYLLRDSYSCDTDATALLPSLARSSDVLLFPGGFDLRAVLPVVGASSVNVFADANFEPHDITMFGLLGRLFETLIYSTSSPHFIQQYGGNFVSLRTSLIGKYTNSVMLKENRGGTRFARETVTSQTPAQSRSVQHSVGVGDCFDAVFVALRQKLTEDAALAYASCIAAEYACTTYPEVFRDAAQAWLRVPAEEIISLSGIALDWEHRPPINIYIAAPDFDHVDRRPLEELVASLKYHNFNPRLPVREHGQMGSDANDARRQMLCEADMRLLNECQLLVAVMLFDDPGTLIEIGIAVERGIPVIVYDPYSRADNLMLTQLPFRISSDLDEIISAVFDRASRVAKK
jgi:nucleoside 2-deoxyribosyltransferase